MKRFLLIFAIYLAVSLSGAFADPVDGYWLFRAPVDSADAGSGSSTARRNGPNRGNGRDVGELWRSSTPDDEGGLLDFEERHCGAWVQFFLDEAAIQSGGQIKNVYCHSWIHVADWQTGTPCLVGFSINESYDATTFYDEVNINQTLAWGNGVAGYDLSVYYNDDFAYLYETLDKLWGVSFKTSGAYPQVLSYPSQRSFCIVNLPSQEVLQTLDSDADGLTDYEELFVTFTDPEDDDTDDDGHDDKQEWDNDRSGWDPYDWGTINLLHPDGIGNKAYTMTLNYRDSEPAVRGFDDTLARELSTEEYELLAACDGAVDSFEYQSDSEHPWSLVQLNFQFDIDLPLEQLIGLNLLYAGVLASSDLDDDSIARDIEVMNVTGGDNERLPAKLGHTPAFYFKPLTNPESLIEAEDGILRARIYARNRMASAMVETDFVELWVITGHSALDQLTPSPEDPVKVAAGEPFAVQFMAIEQDVPIVSGLTVTEIRVGSEICGLTGGALYSQGKWQQYCTAPDLVDGCYDLSVSANTGTVDLDAAASECVCYGPGYICGDADGNEVVNIADAVYIISYIFGGGPAPDPVEAGDADCSETVNIADAVYLIGFIFGGGPTPCAGCS